MYQLHICFRTELLLWLCVVLTLLLYYFKKKASEAFLSMFKVGINFGVNRCSVLQL